MKSHKATAMPSRKAMGQTERKPRRMLGLEINGCWRRLAGCPIVSGVLTRQLPAADVSAAGSSFEDRLVGPDEGHVHEVLREEPDLELVEPDHVADQQVVGAV